MIASATVLSFVALLTCLDPATGKPRLEIDASILHRNMSREDFPHSSDDRAVLTVKLGF